MNEEQLADLLTQHLDALLEGGSLPETLPPEVADLLTIAQSLTEAAPTPRSEFGLALKESLLGPAEGSNGATLPANSAFGGQAVLGGIVMLLVGAAILALLVNVIILGITSFNLPGSSTSTPAPIQTQITPAESTPVSATPTLMIQPTMTSQPSDSVSTPTGTITPVVDVLPAITVTIEIIVEPPVLAPGPGGGDNGGDNNNGHGNDPDHHDEDNPGKGGGDD